MRDRFPRRVVRADARRPLGWLGLAGPLDGRSLRAGSLRAGRYFTGLFVTGLILGQPLPGQAPRPLGDLTPGPAGGEQAEPAIAAGAGMHLAAWADHRSAFTSTLVGEGSRDVHGQLIGADGHSVTPSSFRIAGGLGRKEDVQVAWNGTHWLVTWVNIVPTEFYFASALFASG